MNRWMMYVLSCCMCITACTNNKVSVLSPAQKKAMADSAFKAQIAEITQMEQESLRDRMSIEVKEKTDSILAARRKTNMPAPVHSSVPAPDTLKPVKDTTQNIQL